MRLLSAVLLLALAPSVHAQADTIQDTLDEFAALMTDMEQTLPLRPTVVTTDEDGLATLNVDLEAGPDYMLLLVTDRDGDLDPDADLLDPAGASIATAFGTGTQETLAFVVPESGLHTVQVEVFGCAASCRVGVAIATTLE
ncbi:MAG: hypothetical protein AAGK21_07780 [Bacteroidota bacterium]